MRIHCLSVIQLFLLLITYINALAQVVKTGIVPIFSPRSTVQPITFTFTTPPSLKVTEFPVHVDAHKYPTLRPDAPVSVYQSQNAPWPSNGPIGSISPIIEVPSIDLSVPIYNQAQYFRALQKAGAVMSSSNSQEIKIIPAQKKVVVPVVPASTAAPITSVPRISTVNTITNNFQTETFWKDVEIAWNRASRKLSDTGALSDWRRLWEKLTGALEPFLMNVGELFGKAINRAMRQQAGVTWKSE